MAKENPPGLQEVLDPRQLKRTFTNIEAEFRLDASIILGQEVRDMIEQSCPGATLRMLEVGCGSGAAIEELTRRVMQAVAAAGKKVEGIGIDVRPRPELIPDEILAIDPNGEPGSSPLIVPRSTLDIVFDPRMIYRKSPLVSSLREGDATQLLIASDSVDFGFSYATLIYVADSLRALEEGYRVLHPGAAFFWEICEKELSARPRFAEILDETPGGHEVFTYTPSRSEPRTVGYLACRKKPGNSFQGFPYEMIEELRPADADPSTKRAHYRNARYRKNAHALP